MSETSEKPVRRLLITHSNLKDPFAVEIPWDLLQDSAKAEFDRLDQNDDGDLVYVPQSRYTPPASLKAEVSPVDGTASTFGRLFRAFQGSSPHNHYGKDLAGHARRLEESRRIQRQLFEHAFRYLLTREDDLAQWADFKDALIALTDLAGLIRVARFARDLGKKKKKRKFLKIAEQFLLEALRLAAATPEGREEFLQQIGSILLQMRGELEAIDDDEFKAAAKLPFILEGTGAPVAVSKSDLDRKNEFVLHISVPKGLSAEKIIDGLNAQKPRLRSSFFNGTPGEESFELTAKRIARASDLDPTSSSFILPERLNAVLFGEERDYVHVVFALKDPEKIMGGRDLRKFDIVTQIQEGIQREIQGAFVVHDKKGKDINIAFASDLHISEQDYEIAKTMVRSLRHGHRPEPGIADRVERFYESINEKLEAAIEGWNVACRKGELDYVVFPGDLVDFVNIAVTWSDQGYRGTNFRRLVHILSKLEAPNNAKLGNHCVHIRPFPQSTHHQRFADDPDLYGFQAMHYDNYHFKASGPLQLEALKTLIPYRVAEAAPNDPAQLGFLLAAIREFFSTDGYARPSDEALGPYYRNVETHEADVTHLGNKIYLYNWKTNEEDFNHQNWAFERMNEPIGLNLFRSADVYIGQQRPNGKGARPDVFRHFVRTVEAVKAKGGRMLLTGHYPPFYLGKGTDETPDSSDALRGDANWALRFATENYRDPDSGRPVIDLVVSGHVHQYGEYDFSLEFNSAKEEKAFRRELAQIFEGISKGRIPDDEIYERFREIRKKYKLDQHLVTDRHLDHRKGFPGPVVKEFNADSEACSQRRGTLFVNLPALGPASATSPSGFVTLKIGADGKKKLKTHFFYLESDGTVLQGTGERLPQLKKRHRDRIRAWKVSHGDDPSPPMDNDPPEEPTREEQRTAAFAGPPLFDPLPLLCQYPKGKFCLGAGIGVSLVGASGAGTHFEFTGTPLQWTFPMSETHHPWFGLNYGRFQLNYSPTLNWNADFGVGLGFLEPHGFFGFDFGDPRNAYGGGVRVGAASSILIPALDVYGFGREDKSWGLGSSLLWRLELLSFQPIRPRHWH